MADTNFVSEIKVVLQSIIVTSQHLEAAKQKCLLLLANAECTDMEIQYLRDKTYINDNEMDSKVAKKYRNFFGRQVRRCQRGPYYYTKRKMVS
jgi:hypothetical protein